MSKKTKEKPASNSARYRYSGPVNAQIIAGIETTLIPNHIFTLPSSDSTVARLVARKFLVEIKEQNNDY